MLPEDNKSILAQKHQLYLPTGNHTLTALKDELQNFRNKKETIENE